MGKLATHFFRIHILISMSQTQMKVYTSVKMTLTENSVIRKIGLLFIIIKYVVFQTNLKFRTRISCYLLFLIEFYDMPWSGRGLTTCPGHDAV